MEGGIGIVEGVRLEVERKLTKKNLNGEEKWERR